MSAQIIAALGRRAAKLEASASALDAEPANHPLESAAKSVIADQERWLASQFRELANEAEQHWSPRDGL